MTIYPFRVAHLDNLLLQPAQAYLREHCDNADYKLVCEQGYSFSLLDDDGQTLACAGLLKLWEGRANAWALISAHVGGAGMLAVVRAVRRELLINDYERIEAYVDHDFEAGHRLMRLLGFKNETPNGMRNFVRGRTNDLYSRCK